MKMNLVSRKEIQFLRKEYEKAVKEWNDSIEKKKCLENILLSVCPHRDVEFGSERGNKCAICKCKLCGLDVIGIR